LKNIIFALPSQEGPDGAVAQSVEQRT